MGLDQMAGYENKEGDIIEFHTWRKHPNLHGWMEKLYRRRNPGDRSDFNCVAVELTRGDIRDLASAIIENRLPQTSGFFFGESFGDPEEIEHDMKFIAKAVSHLNSDRKIFYNSWW